MAEYVAGADDGEEDETPDTVEEAQQRAAASDAAAETVAKIVGGSKLYGNLFKDLQLGPIFPKTQWIQRDLLGTGKIIDEMRKSMQPSWVNQYVAGLRSMDQLAGTTASST
ncbi:hypothetical protein [Streptomyces sp. 039-1]|uniref:hypothetical protein n=1 Tax=Streptomyces sp. 039-1 TaxID=2789263 RepID=UPI0039F48163